MPLSPNSPSPTTPKKSDDKENVDMLDAETMGGDGEKTPAEAVAPQELPPLVMMVTCNIPTSP